MKKQLIWAAAVAAALSLTGCSTQTYPTTTSPTVCKQCGTEGCEHNMQCNENCKEHCNKHCTMKHKHHYHKKAAAKKAAPAEKAAAPASAEQPAKN